MKRKAPILTTVIALLLWAAALPCPSAPSTATEHGPFPIQPDRTPAPHFALAGGRSVRLIVENGLFTALTVAEPNAATPAVFAFPHPVFRIDDAGTDAFGFFLKGPISSVNDYSVFLDPEGREPPQFLPGRGFATSPDRRYTAFLPWQLRYPGQTGPAHVGVRVYDRALGRIPTPPAQPPASPPRGVLRSPLTWNKHRLRWVVHSEGNLYWCGHDLASDSRITSRKPTPLPNDSLLAPGAPKERAGELLWRCHVSEIRPDPDDSRQYRILLVPAEGLRSGQILWREPDIPPPPVEKPPNTQAEANPIVA